MGTPERPGRVEVLPARRDTTGGVAVTATGAESRSERLKGFTLGELVKLGELASSSQMFDGRDQAKRLTPEQASMKILAGLEVDIPVTQALAGIDIIDGLPAFRANLLAAMIKRSGKYRYRVVEWTDDRCEIEWREKVDGEWIEPGPNTEHDLEDAKREGLLDKRGQTWQRYPKAMNFARALSAGARAYCGDVLAAAYTPEDLVDVDPSDYDEHSAKINQTGVYAPDDDPLDGEVVASETPASPPTEAETPPPTAAEPEPTAAAAEERHWPSDAELKQQVKAEAAEKAKPRVEAKGRPTESLVDLVGSTDVSSFTVASAGISKVKLDHLRKIAKPLDSTGLGRVVAWATRNDGDLSTADPAKLSTPRYGELAHFLEHASPEDRALLAEKIVAWESSSNPPADETGQGVLA